MRLPPELPHYQRALVACTQNSDERQTLTLKSVRFVVVAEFKENLFTQFDHFDH